MSNNSFLEKAQHLLQTNRPDEAEGFIKLSLVGYPDDPYALGLLAQVKLVKSEYREALELAQNAVGIKADEPYLLLILAKAYFLNKDLASARSTAREGRSLAPNIATFFTLLSQMSMYEKKWDDALNHANQGLELDPEDVDLVNLRAQALVKLNRQEEAEATLDYALHKAPEDAHAHANKGWVAIEKGEYDRGVEHFLEALRHDPTDEYSRHGLKEAIKGKNLIYRGLLKYFLWMSKMQEKYQWGFIIGIYLLYRAVLALAENVPALAPFLYPLIVLYVLFAFSTWIATPISNLFLRLHPIGKHALSDDEKLGSNVTGGLLLVCLLSFVAYFATGNELGFRLGIVCGLMLIPAGGAFSVPAGTSARKGLLGFFLALFALGLIWTFVPAMMWAIGLVAVGIFAYGWVANYFISKAAKEF